MKLLVFHLVCVAVLAKIIKAEPQGMATEAGHGFPEGFPPHFPKYTWAFTPHSDTHCQDHAKPVASHNSLSFFGFTGCGRFTLKKEDGIKAVLLWVREDQHAMEFQISSHTKRNYVAKVAPNSWQCVSLVDNAQGTFSKNMESPLIGKLKSISEC